MCIGSVYRWIQMGKGAVTLLSQAAMYEKSTPNVPVYKVAHRDPPRMPRFAIIQISEKVKKLKKSKKQKNDFFKKMTF